MKITLRYASIVLAALAAIPTVRAQNAAPVPAPAPNPNQPDPVYPFKYKIPSVEEVHKVLSAMRDRLDAASPAKLVNAETHDEVTDFSKPVQVAFEKGHDKSFPQISYPMGVVYYAMLSAAEATGDQKFIDFDNARFEIFAKAFPAMDQWPADSDPRRNPFTGLLKPSSLDSCGAMCASMAKANRMKIGPDMSPITARGVDWVHHKQFRMEDGTLARKRPYPESIWADDMYMGVPLMAQIAATTNDKELFDDCAKQVIQISEKLFIKSSGLYTHGWDAGNPDNHPRHYWGRANGWCMVANVELLGLLPADHPARPKLIEILKAHAQGIAEVQSGVGMWHQVLDRNDSYLESSCTAMFSYCLAKGVNNGWLPAESYAPVALSGWDGLMQKMSEDGHLDGTCIGTNYGEDFAFYYHRPATDDMHGYGPAILAGSEIIKLLKNEKLHLNVTPNSPILNGTSK